MIGHLKSDLETPRQGKSDPAPRTLRTLCKNNGKETSSPDALARRGRWSFSLFLLISGAAFFARDVNFFAAVPENLRPLLGSAPPPDLISIALAVYGFSALILLLSSLANNSKPASGWTHLGYRTVFYFFYLVSNSLAENFMAVFYIGLALYVLEQFCIWTYTSKAPHQKRNVMEQRL